MPLSSPDLRRRIEARLLQALCLERGTVTGSCPKRGKIRPGNTGGVLRTAGREGGHEQGSAVVEFTFLALLLMVPLVYFIITVGQIQGGSFAVVGAADQAAKVYVAQPDEATATAAAEQAVAIALADFGHRKDEASVAISCNPADCTAPGTVVTANVRLTVPLPFVPFGDDFLLSATELEASASQLVGRFR